SNICKRKMEDIVIIKEDNLPPSVWPLDKVASAHPGKDGIKKVNSIQRLFLLYITGAYRRTPTAALQVVTGLQTLHQIQPEATYARVARARSSSNFFTVIFSPTDYESKSSGIHIHPPNFLIHNQIPFAENHIDSGAKVIYTDGSKTDEGTGRAYCILENYGIIASWQGKLDRSNSVFQAEILAIRMAIEAASSLDRPIKIWIDSLSSLMAILNPKSLHSIVR
ncbi:Protein piccolo, partial [Araneus ventricosus]